MSNIDYGKFIYTLQSITTLLKEKIVKFQEKNPEVMIQNVTIHPGKLNEQNCYQQLNNAITNNQDNTIKCYFDIYTIIYHVNEFKAIENEQIEITLNLAMYVLQVWKPTIEKNNRLSLSFLSLLTMLINNNRWAIPYVFPSKNIKQLNLYGLTVEAKQLAGIKGWNPSIQAYAKDLYEQDHTNEQPKNLELFLINWEQTLRISDSIFTENNHKIKEIIINEKIK